MEIGELVSMLSMSVLEDPYCDEKDSPTDWQAKINDWGTRQNCSGTTLYNNMNADKDKDQGYLGPPSAFIAKPGPGKKWGLADVTRKSFPVQAHHLIPKNHLPDHPVCAFLAKKYKKHEHYELTADTAYDTDHANNGYCLPYATPLAEWKKVRSDDAAKLKLCFQVMHRTGRQLHQGSHRADPYEGPVADDEEPRIHPVGYLSAVDVLLEVVQGGAQEHVVTCAICNKGETGKGKIKIQPVEAVVRHMDQVAGIVKLLIDANREFISEPASLYGRNEPLEMELPAWLGG
jgi:hypothetical protein